MPASCLLTIHYQIMANNNGSNKTLNLKVEYLFLLEAYVNTVMTWQNS